MSGAEIEFAIDDLAERWHAGEGKGMPLHEWLGMTREQYGPWMARAVVPAGYTPPRREPGPVAGPGTLGWRPPTWAEYNG